MSLLLSLKGLSDPESNLIRTIVRLSSELKGSWTVQDGPGRGHSTLEIRDSTIADEETHDPRLDELPWGASKVVVVLPRGESPLSNELRRPIRAEDVIETLNAASQNRAQFAPTQPAFKPSEAPAAGASTAIDWSNESAPLPPLPQLTGMQGGGSRLLRWPPTRLMLGDARRVRMATLLARQSFNARQLAVMCSCPIEACEAFLHDLRADNLLVDEEPQAREPARQASWITPGVMASGGPANLLRRLRRKLGIGGTRD